MSEGSSSYRVAPGLYEAAVARARELMAQGLRYGPLELKGTNIRVNVYVGCEPSKITLFSLAPVAVLDGNEIWLGAGEPKEAP